MERHYAERAAGRLGRALRHAYATMHPWEDWAETFAHYLHIRDMLQTAVAYGVSVYGPAVPPPTRRRCTRIPAPRASDLRALLEAWLPLTYALNAINRSMGDDDLYPFVLAPGGDREAGAHRRARPGRASSMSEATVPVDGEFEMARTFTVEPELERALEQPGLERLTLDLSGTTFIDSTGIGVVLRLANDAESRGVELAIVPGPPEVQRVFATAGLTEVLPFQN